MAKAINPENTWGEAEYLLADIANSLRWLVWSKTKDAEKGKNPPKMIEPPRKEMKVSNEYALDLDEYKRRLALPREEIKQKGRE